MLTLQPAVRYDNYRMAKRAVSVTLSPDNLLWLKGRARAAGVGSVSECLDQLLTRVRLGRRLPRPAKSMKGALAVLALGSAELPPAVPAEVWRSWETTWDDLLDGVRIETPPTVPRRGRGAASRPRGGRA